MSAADAWGRGGGIREKRKWQQKNGNPKKMATKKMATPPRFELKLTGPKPVVLPLHHGVACVQCELI